MAGQILNPQDYVIRGELVTFTFDQSEFRIPFAGLTINDLQQASTADSALSGANVKGSDLLQSAFDVTFRWNADEATVQEISERIIGDIYDFDWTPHFVSFVQAITGSEGKASQGDPNVKAFTTALWVALAIVGGLLIFQSGIVKKAIPN